MSSSSDACHRDRPRFAVGGLGCSIAPVIRPVTSSGELAAIALSATLRPRRSTTMRSATANTSGMRWLIRTTAMPWSRRRRIRFSTSATWRTLIAAVGSSISTILASDSRVRAIATAWRWPPDICRPGRAAGSPTSARRTARRRARYMAPCSRGSRTARSRLPELAPEKDVRRRRQVVAERQVLIDDLDAVLRAPRPAGGSARRWPSMRDAAVRSGGKLPAMILTSVDLPAPLSPIRPTTSPGSSVRSTRRRAPGWRRSASKCRSIAERTRSAFLLRAHPG